MSEEKKDTPHDDKPVKVIDMTDQQMYDLTRTAVEDSNNEKFESKKLNDHTHSLNTIDVKCEVSMTAYMQALNLKDPIRHIIGMNEYLLLPKRRLKEMPTESAGEILAIHGKSIYPIPNDSGIVSDESEEAIAIPLRTRNTPQPFELPSSITPAFTPDDAFQENLNIDKTIGTREWFERRVPHNADTRS